MKYKDGHIIHEVGDWVCQETYSFIGKITQVTKVEKNKIGVRQLNGINGYEDVKQFSKAFRPATQQEIYEELKKKEIYIDKYLVEFEKGFIKVGCITVSKKEFMEIGKEAGWVS